MGNLIGKLITVQETPNALSENNSSGDVLNEDCLLKIFSYLSIHDMMSVERVCKKWYLVSKQWFKKVQTIVYDVNSHDVNHRLELYEKNDRKIYEKNGVHSFSDHLTILHSCGDHIKYYKANIPVPLCEIKYNSYIFSSIPKLCKNIIDAQIYADNSIYHSYNILFMRNWEKLVKLDIKYLQLPVNKNFTRLLSRNKQLKTFILSFDSSTGNFDDDNFFTYLPTTIEKIKITDESMKKIYRYLKHFISASEKFTSLQSLELSGFCYYNHDVLEAIANIQTLTHLHLTSVILDRSHRKFELIAKLKGLKSLRLPDNDDLDEDSIINIVESCLELEQLDIKCISNGIRLTDRGMDAIAKLKKLKCLTINAEHVTVGPIINLCDRLEVLRCHYWRINNNDAIRLLRRATNLKFMDVDENRNLTKDFLLAAMEIAHRRRNLLCITGSNYLFDVEIIDSPYLRYFKRFTDVPLKIFSNHIRNYIRD